MLSDLNKNKKRNIVIPVEEYRHLIEISTYGGQLEDKIDRFAEYVNSEIKKGYEMVDAHICGAIFGFKVAENKEKS